MGVERIILCALSLSHTHTHTHICWPLTVITHSVLCCFSQSPPFSNCTPQFVAFARFSFGLCQIQEPGRGRHEGRRGVAHTDARTAQLRILKKTRKFVFFVDNKTNKEEEEEELKKGKALVFCLERDSKKLGCWCVL